MSAPFLMGTLHASLSRGKEIFSFEYAEAWLKSRFSLQLDPDLGFYSGPQYPKENRANFGLFLDSSPDRWGRVLMRRREEQCAREEKRSPQTLLESDYLLGVYDRHRMGALRFRESIEGPFLDDSKDMASPPWTSLSELEHASLALEKDHAETNINYAKWLRLLVAPGGSLGGARPKASVVDQQRQLWIAKFPSRQDDIDIGAWELVVHRLAEKAKLNVSEAQCRQFKSKHHTFLTKRFDRTKEGRRIHFASSMTLLGRGDGDDAHAGVSYLDLVNILIKHGAQPRKDLEELWRRIVFNICVSNVDDHLRNHGFLLTKKGWILAPAYDMNAVETGNGLKLNISQNDNAQDLELAKDVSKYFRLSSKEANKIIDEVIGATTKWRDVAKQLKIPMRAISRMGPAFRVADAKI